MYKMHLFLLLSIISTAFSNELTTYFWERNDQDPTKGRCYEVDIETGGERFSKRASKIKCRPKTFEFKFLPNEKGFGGRCFEIDLNENSTGYIRQVEAKMCKPDEVIYVQNP